MPRTLALSPSAPSWVRTVLRLLVPAVVLGLLMIALGELITRVVQRSRLERWDASLPKTLADNRSHGWTTASGIATQLGSTPVVVTLAILAAGTAAWAWRRWREPLFIMATAVGEVVLHVTTALTVNRPRPPVTHLDDAPPTSSFPSGHTAAITALSGAVAVLVLMRTKRPAVRIPVLVLVVAGPLLVALSRLYRGMHYPTDVAGGMLLALVWLTVTTRTLLRPGTGDHRSAAASAAPNLVAVVNPLRFTTRGPLRASLRAAAARSGSPDPVWVATTVNDPGYGMARQAVRDGADLVLACGGDGTVRAVADALAGSGVPLGVVPGGTGNLLVRNLGLPLALDDAVAVAIGGTDRAIDLGVVAGLPEGTGRFTVMAGMGFDAAMLADTPEQLKARVGWFAYVVSGLRHLRDRSMRLTISVDSGEEQEVRARAVIVGNVGRLQGGIPLLPEAAPDDGLLDVVVLSPRGIAGWAYVVGSVLLRRRTRSSQVARLRGRSVLVRSDRDHPRELDGEPVEADRVLSVSLEPRALIVRVPRL